jgi:hypothetical protein
MNSVSNTSRRASHRTVIFPASFDYETRRWILKDESAIAFYGPAPNWRSERRDYPTGFIDRFQDRDLLSSLRGSILEGT